MNEVTRGHFELSTCTLNYLDFMVSMLVSCVVLKVFPPLVHMCV